MQKTKRGGSARVLVALSALSAIGIILGKFLAFNITEFMRFSLENITVIFTGVVFGPLLGAAVGAVQDLVGCIAVGYAINPIITLGSAAVGLVSGAVFSLTRGWKPHVRLLLSVALAHLLGSVVIKSAGLSIFYSLPFGVTVLWRLLNYAVVGVAEGFLLCIILKSKQLLAQINKITPFSLGAGFKSAKEASVYARSVSNVFSKPGLERVEALLLALGSPQKRVEAVHVAGTNGKGSFTAILTSILGRSGLRVGSFTSPYLVEMREAIRIGGEPISEGELVALFDRLSPIADAMEDKPTEFELLTAAAYLAFSEAGVDAAVIECGMGAARDATNVISSPLLSVITGVAKDHTAFLGNTLADIAREKAGVIKPGRPVLVGEAEDGALDIIKAKAAELGAELYKSADFRIGEQSLNGTTLDCLGIASIRLRLLGVHQPKNAALAITAAKILSERFPAITDEAIRLGTEAAVWHGRFEPLITDPMFIFDGAHNLDGVKSAVRSIQVYFAGKVVCLTGVLADKEYEAMADEISAVAASVVTVTPDSARALSAESYAEVFASRGVDAIASKSVSEGVRTALNKAEKESLPVVCLGSLYLYREVNEAVKSV